MRLRTSRVISIIVGATLLTVSFQNCGKAGFDTMNEDSTSLDLEKSDASPFAFDAGFDQISYNSCSGPLASGPAYTTLRAGAYNSAGVWINSSYFEYARNSGALKPVYPATEVSNEQIKIALATSSNNIDSVLQMAVREKGSPQRVITPGRNPAELQDYVNVLGDLTDDRWMDPLVKSTGRTLFFDLAPSGLRKLEAGMHINTDEGVAQGFRDKVGVAGMLALTFKTQADEGSAYAARPVSTDPKKVYGRAYAPSFSRDVAPYTRMLLGVGADASVNIYDYLPNNIVTQIQETDLRNPSVAIGNWNCSPNRRFVIMHARDASLCPIDPFSYFKDGVPSLGMSAAQFRLEHEVIRRHLKAEDWDISVRFRCAVPKAKTGSCYPDEKLNNGSPVPIEYDQSKECFQGIQMSYPGATPTNRCAQYISICTRS